MNNYLFLKRFVLLVVEVIHVCEIFVVVWVTFCKSSCISYIDVITGSVICFDKAVSSALRVVFFYKISFEISF